eukprot:11310145-Karenia_brevis.AAC.1
MMGEIKSLGDMAKIGQILTNADAAPSSQPSGGQMQNVDNHAHRDDLIQKLETIVTKATDTQASSVNAGGGGNVSR